VEKWNNGQKNKAFKPIIPSFQYSNLFARRALRLIFFSSSLGGAEKAKFTRGKEENRVDFQDRRNQGNNKNGRD